MSATHDPAAGTGQLLCNPPFAAMNDINDKPLVNVRKAVQIAQTNGSVTALCDDGTIWFLQESEFASESGQGLEWHQLPPIPQPNARPFVWPDVDINSIPDRGF